VRTTIKDIAKQLGVSANTISKALNGKPQVSEKMRRLIVETAEKMEYSPNKSARALVRKEIRIAAVYPLEPHEFYRYVAEGVRAAAHELSDYKCVVLEYAYPSIETPEALRRILTSLPDENIDALVLTCCHRFETYRQELATIADAGIPIMYNTIFGEDLKGVIGGVRTNTTLAGRIAAEFLGMTIRRESSRKVALLVGERNLLVHKECIDGFVAEAPGFGLDVVEIYETYGERRLAQELTERLFRLHPDLAGIYVTSHNATGVCDYLEQHREHQGILVIGHDLYPALNEKLRARSLSSTLFQNQFEHGRESIRMMADYLVGHRKRQDCLKLITPQVVFGSMIGSFPYYDMPL